MDYEQMTLFDEPETFEGTEKEFIELFQPLCGSLSSLQVWSDIITAMACAISNAVDKEHFDKREKEYMECAERIGGTDALAKLFAVVVMALDKNPQQDFLGSLYMQLDMGSHWKGQFFTPYNICNLMARMNIDNRVDNGGFVPISDPACGAGATLIAAANILKERGLDYQNRALFAGQDLDRITGMMCYIQISLLGCAGYVVIGDTLSNPMAGDALFPAEKDGQELWLTPMFFSETWHWRRMFRRFG